MMVLMAWLAAGALAADEEALLDVYGKWTQLAVSEIRLEGAPAPFRAEVTGIDAGEVAVHARAGAIISRDSRRMRPSAFEVVVGSDALDSARYSVGRSGPRSSIQLNIVPEGAGIAVERDLWLAADASYKAAVMRFEDKTAARAALGGEPAPPDRSSAEVVSEVLVSPHALPSEEALAELAMGASEVLASRGLFELADVRIRALDGTLLAANSEGLRLGRPTGYVVVHAEVSALRSDGVTVHDEQRWVVRDAASLPTLDELEPELVALADSVAARAGTPSAVEETYEGPVLFEGEAAAWLLYTLISPQVAGTPPEPLAGVSYRRQVRTGARIGRRLLPEGWTVRDAPALDTPWLDTFAIDQEGVPAQEVVLVEDGWVTDVLMTRVPRHDRTESNGHARGSVQGSLAARPTNLVVEPPRLQRDRRFERELAAVQKASGVDEVLVVTRLDRGREGRVSSPTAAVWRSADGSERPAQRLVFESVDRRTLRDIVAAGGELTMTTTLVGFSPGSQAGRDSGMPITITAPSRLVVQDMELSHPGPDSRPRALPAPENAPLSVASPSQPTP